MPRRGYRKGVSDNKSSRPHVIKSRIDIATHRRLHAEADARGMTFSSLVAHILAADATNRRLTLPHARMPAAHLIRALDRIGNNLNQIAKQANLMRLHLLEHETRTCLATLVATIQRL